MDESIYLEDFDVVLETDDDGVYTPSMYKHNDNWIYIGEGDILQDWIMYIKMALSKTNKVTMETDVGNLFTYQWGFSVLAILKVMDFKAETLDVEWSRQSGKTFLLEHMISFLTVFAPRYKTNIIGDKWTTITCSYKEMSATKNFTAFRKNVKKAVEIYNEIYGNSRHKLVYGAYKTGTESKTIADTKTHLEIDVIQGDISQGWAQIYALSTNTDNDGLSALLTYVDEAILVDAKDFYRSIAPFGIANSACTIITGIASTDSSCLQYSAHFNDEVYKSIYTWEDIYRIRKTTSPREAEVYKQGVLSAIQKTGGHNSTETQTNFYMSWEITDGKFTTREQLRKNKVFQSDLGQPNINADYIVAGLDLSTVSDYQVLTIAEAYKLKDGYKQYNKHRDDNINSTWDLYVKEIVTFNPDRQRMDSEIEAGKVAKILKTNKVDILMVDSSGTQKAQLQEIYKAIKKLGINTLVIPYDFGGFSNKANMMSELELNLFSGRLKLPKEDYKKKHDGFERLYDELLVFKKEKPKGNARNIAYKAPNGATDDHVISLSLCNFALTRLEHLVYKREFIEIGTERFRAQFIKFDTIKEVEEDVYLPQTYMTVL